MKSLNIFTTLLAVCALAIGCNKVEEPMALNNLQLSQTYVAIPAAGGSVKVTFTATEDWTLEIPTEVNGDKYLDDSLGVVTPKKSISALELSENSWVEISPKSGSAGTTTVTFSAVQATESHSSSLQIKVGDNIQNIIVAQVAGKVDVPIISVKDAEAAVGSTVRVKGACTAISSTVYGNWYLKDDAGNTIYIYGTVDDSGSYNWPSFNIAVGDVVTVQGPVTLYNGTYELVDASVIEVKKALILADSPKKTIGKEAEEFALELTNKGENITYESASDWLTVGGFSAKGEKLSFSVMPTENTTGTSRTGEVVFKATKGKDATEFVFAVTQLGSVPKDGSIGDIADAVAPGSSSNRISIDYNIKDAVVTYVNGSNFFIEDGDASDVATNKRRGVLIYDSNCTLKAGDHVSGRIYGQGYAYNNLPEVTSFNYELATVKSGDEPEPVVITLAELNTNYNNYLSRYIKVASKLSEAIDVTYSKITTNGKLSDGTNEIALYAQSSGKFDGSKIYFYLQAPKDAEVEVVTIPGIFKTTKQLNVWTADQVTVK